MRTFAKIVLALGFAGAIGVAASVTALVGSTPANAQGFYFNAPGVHIGVGPGHHHRYYGDGPRYYDYEPGYVSPYYSGPCRPGFTVQDGICKPYRGY